VTVLGRVIVADELEFRDSIHRRIILIAILAVLFLNHFNKRVRLAVHQMDLLKVMVLNRLYGGGSTHQGMPVREAHSSGVAAIRGRPS
jgi:hypothetical protein